MDNATSVSDAGLNSLSGFAYQIKVFIYQLTLMQLGQRVEFETLDDVAVSSLPAKDTLSDLCFKWSINEDSSIAVFQVKQTNVTDSVGRQVLYNWLLALAKKPSINKYTLYVSCGYSFTAKILRNGAEKEYKTIMDSDRASTALVSRVKQLYNDNFSKFESDYNTICSKAEIVVLDDIDELIKKQLIVPFHAAAYDIGNTYHEKRVEELLTRICARIIDCAGRRIPYICEMAEYMQLCEEICNDISPTHYAPDYESFKQVFAATELTEEIAKSREYQQLSHCSISSADILEHLRWEQYYQNIRQHYLSDAKKSTISKTESIARQNHKDVILELYADNKDTPLLRLIKTKARDISTLSDEFSRWGTYVFLTQDNLPNQISWKEEIDEFNEE